MRVNVYSQELTDEVKPISKVSNTGREYHAVQMMLHSSEKLHHPPMDDDRSAVTFWLPRSANRREQLAKTFEAMAALVRSAPLDGEVCHATMSGGGFENVTFCTLPKGHKGAHGYKE